MKEEAHLWEGVACGFSSDSNNGGNLKIKEIRYKQEEK